MSGVKTSELAGRREAAVALYASGAHLREVGQALGVSGEQVRLYLNAEGVGARHRGRSVDPIRVLAAVRAPGVMTLTEAARSLACDRSSAHVALRELGVHAAVRRLYRLRRRHAIATRLRALADRLGRTPTTIDLIGDGPDPQTLIRSFGSVRRAMIAADLAPRNPGRNRSPLLADAGA